MPEQETEDAEPSDDLQMALQGFFSNYKRKLRLSVASVNTIIERQSTIRGLLIEVQPQLKILQEHWQDTGKFPEIHTSNHMEGI